MLPNPPVCTIAWNTLDLSAWDARFAKVRNATLLQSYDYAVAACPVLGLRARWGVIAIDGAEAGLVQILETAFPGNVFHGVYLDRGPLWFDGFGTPEQVGAFFAAFARAFPRRFGRRFRILPEIGVADVAVMPDCFRRRAPGYKTAWWDLTGDEIMRRAMLRKNWRGDLRRAENNSAMQTQWAPWGGSAVADINDVVAGYRVDQIVRGYPGPSARMVRALAGRFAATGNLLIGRAVVGGETVAMVMVFVHGTSATYQIGWTTASGRATYAHHILLWHSSVILRQRGVTAFDLGGIGDDRDGLALFKTGTGATIVESAGFYS